MVAMDYEYKEYYLKHKNNLVMKFTLDNEFFIVRKADEIYDYERLPIIYGNNDISLILRNFDKWVEMRGIPKSREDYNVITYKNKKKSNRELTVGEYALNLTDHYWIHGIDENLKWENMNLFDNDYKQEEDLKPVLLEGKRGNPNVSVDGNQIKAWKKENNINYLWKKGRGERMQEPFNEEIASKIMDLFGIEHVNYNVKRISGNIPVSICKCMIDKDTEYMGADYAMYSIEKKGLEKYERYISICIEKGIADAKKKIDEMIAIDYIIGNEDRHPWNFGIIRNANNLEWIKTAPLFDNGNSLFYDTDSKEMMNEKKDSFCRWLDCENETAIKNIDYPGWYDESKKSDVLNIIYEGLSKNERLKTNKAKNVINIAEERLKTFEKIISNKKQAALR